MNYKMIKSLLHLSLISITIAFMGCVESSTDKFYEVISEDPLFFEYATKYQKIVTETIPIVDELDKQKLIRELERESDVVKVLSKYIDDPEDYIGEIKALYQKGQFLLEKYPELGVMPNDEKENLFSGIITRSAFKSDSCYAQLDADLEACRDAAYVAAAGCGLAAPTLLGAIACGGVVIVAKGVCDRHALKSADICLNEN